MPKITLSWAEKFREIKEKKLCKQDTINEFSEYCDQKEKEINKAWRKKNERRK